MKFKELNKESITKIEENYANYWNKIDVLNKSINKGKENYVFYDGPATANAMPGVHHVLSKLLKDTICKYKTMQGYRVVRKVGWDTHGLPVEVAVEKQLGLNGKKQIEEYGIKEFNNKCKESVLKNEEAFKDLTTRIGQFIDMKDPYMPMDNNYMETVWWLLKNMFDNGYIYEGNKTVPFCPRCGTALASHEVAQGYKEMKANTVIVPMKLKEKDEYFLVWTTTPWTLMGNVAVAVNPNEEYLKVESKGFKFILAKKLSNKVLGEEYKVIETYKGKDLEGIEYEQLMPFIKPNKKAFYVTCADFVTMEDGTGIVHIAPAFGEDDSKIGKQYNLPTLNPVNTEGKYTEGPWKDMFVLDTDIEIIKWLKENDKLFKKEAMMHNYPHCWRCETPLLYYGIPTWFIETTKVKEKMIENNKNIEWYPSYVGEKRLGNWLEELKDWGISRSRYWGTPLPIWKCECGHVECIGSIKELVDKSIEDIDDKIELHRPYIDEIHIKCSKCNKLMNREPDVIDVWFDSGAMPFAQYHYPFENKEIFEDQFPADFICEGIDQTRGWFYVLLAISTLINGKSPYKRVLVNDHIQDKDGQKMSKSKGNTKNPFELLDNYGADALRWYMLYVSPAWTPTKFDEEGLKEVISKFLNTLKNTYNFFVLYANTDNMDPREFNVEYNERPEVDKWLLSKYNQLVKDVTTNMEIFDMTKSVKLIQSFVSEDLSNWYIRRNRRRFWASELDDNKKAVYNTTYEVLLGLSKLIAPMIPYISEEIYQNLTNKESVHLDDYPVSDESLIDNHIEERMDLVRDLISLGRSAREEANIKVRQPLLKVVIDGKHKSLISDLVPLILEELNIKEVVFEDNLDKFMNYNLKPNYKNAGPIFGKNIKDYSNKLEELDAKEVLSKLEQGSFNIELDKSYEITKDLIDVRISSKEGFNVQMLNNQFVILDTTLNQDLIDEGLARELVSKVQQLRKTADFNVIDRINVYYDGSNEIKTAINKHIDFIKKETLADSITEKQNISDKYNLNSYETGIEVEKI